MRPGRPSSADPVGHQSQAEPLADGADAIDGPNRVARKRLPRTVHDLRSDAEDTDVSVAPCPGGVSSATTWPRSVTSTRSPALACRMYLLNRFSSSRTPTVFMDGNVAPCSHSANKPRYRGTRPGHAASPHLSYPQVASFRGTGSPDDPGVWTCDAR